MRFAGAGGETWTQLDLSLANLFDQIRDQQRGGEDKRHENADPEIALNSDEQLDSDHGVPPPFLYAMWDPHKAGSHVAHRWAKDEMLLRRCAGEILRVVGAAAA